MIGIRLLLCLPVALVAATMHAVPWLTRQGRLFGRTVTEEFRKNEGRALVRRYELRLLPWTAAAVVGWGLLPLDANPLWRVALLLLLVTAAGWNVWGMFARVPGSGGREEQMRSAELKSTGVGWWMAALFAVPAAALAGTAAYLHAHWAEIPERFPVHWNLQGVANGWSVRTAAGVYGPLLIGGALLLMMAGIAALTWWGARRQTWSPPVVAVLVTAAWMLGGMFAMVGLLPLHYFPPSEIFLFEGVMLAVMAVAVVVAVRRARASGTRGEVTPESCWKGGIFYYNPDDPALVVEKRIGVGWTFNFGHRLAWVIVGLILLIPVGTTVFLIATAKR